MFLKNIKVGRWSVNVYKTWYKCNIICKKSFCWRISEKFSKLRILPGIKVWVIPFLKWNIFESFQCILTIFTVWTEDLRLYKIKFSVFESLEKFTKKKVNKIFETNFPLFDRPQCFWMNHISISYTFLSL